MSRWPKTVGILGAGALGCLFAHAIASHTSTKVWLFARSPLPGSRVAVEGAGTAAVSVAALPSDPVDLLIVLVKSYATADALRWAAGAVGEETWGLTLQNGLGNAESLAEALGRERVLAGTTAQGATLLEPGLVRHAGNGLSHLAPWTAQGPEGAVRAGEAAALLRSAGLPAEAVHDARPAIWSKLAVNCGMNALTALLRVPNGELLARPHARQLMEAAAREAGEVAAAMGIALPADPVQRTLEVASITGANRSSMLQDIERGRRTEIDAINGAVAAAGQRVGVPTPVNDTLAALIRALSPVR